MKRFFGTRVLVTGGTGFIGSHVVRRLLAEGAEVHVLVRRKTRPGRLQAQWDRIRRHPGDLRDPVSLENCVRTADPIFVFHLAGERDEAGLENDVVSTIRLGDALRWHGKNLKRLIRAGQAGPAALARKADFQLSRTLWFKYSLPLATLRLGSVYGPDQAEGNFPADIIRSVLSGKPLRHSGEGAASDFVYVEDVAEAFLLAALREGIDGKTIPVGTGKNITRGDVCFMICRKLGAPPPEILRSPGAARASADPADLQEAKRLLEWTPGTGLSAGLDRTISWHKTSGSA